MADFSATKRKASFEDWKEALESMVELNGYSFDISDEELETAYNDHKRVDDFFYEVWADE